MEKLLEKLHPLERKALSHLSSGKTVSELAKDSGLEYIEAMRAVQWLENKSVLKINSKAVDKVRLGKNGKVYKVKRLPERRFLQAVQKPSRFKDIMKNADLEKDELNVCLGILKKKNAISIEKGKVTLTDRGKKLIKKEMPEEKFLSKDFPVETKKLTDIERHVLGELVKRKNIIVQESKSVKTITLTNIGEKIAGKKLTENFEERLTQEMMRQGSWKGKKFRRYDIKINVPDKYPGRRHFVNQAIDFVKRVWLDMGFREMHGNFVQVGFWNFDALFTAQDHPVRELQDTYYIRRPAKGRLPEEDTVKKVRRTHEDGWTTGSKGWQYKWDPEEARRNVLRTHTTCLSARTISKLKKQDLPAKFFAVGKNFRNETLDWSHLFELIQVEGIVVDPDANFRHLIGYLKDFFMKMGYPKVRVRPAYFPYTEPSAEVDVFHPVHKQWFELGGSGIFRPEVTKPLFGEEIPVLAWGLGFDRSILEYYNLSDIRELYNNDLDQIKKMKLWMK